MLRLLAWLFFLPLAAAVVFLAITHHDPVTIDLAPLLSFKADVQVFVLVLGSIMIGFIWGGATLWIAAAVTRRRLRQRSRDLEQSTFRLQQAEDRLRKAEALAKAQAQTRDTAPANNRPLALPADAA